MADNYQTNIPTTTGAIFGSDEVVVNTATVHVPAVKIMIGTEGAAEGYAGAGNPMPISGTVSLAAGTASVGFVGLSTGGAIYLKTPSGGDIPADTTSGLAVKFVTAQSVTVAAGTATIGTVHLATSAHIAPSLATDTWGPKTVNVTASGTNALVTSPGANSSLYVTAIRVVNRATTVSTPIGLSDGTTRDKSVAAANGGGYVMQYKPHWKLPGNTALNCVVCEACNVDVTVHFYSGAT